MTALQERESRGQLDVSLHPRLSVAIQGPGTLFVYYRQTTGVGPANSPVLVRAFLWQSPGMGILGANRTSEVVPVHRRPLPIDDFGSRISTGNESEIRTLQSEIGSCGLFA